jgi:hypothetical protein
MVHEKIQGLLEKLSDEDLDRIIDELQIYTTGDWESESRDEKISLILAFASENEVIRAVAKIRG